MQQPEVCRGEASCEARYALAPVQGSDGSSSRSRRVSVLGMRMRIRNAGWVGVRRCRPAPAPQR
eukprot:364640-Chlamydomonas_euryale.AAC.15